MRPQTARGEPCCTPSSVLEPRVSRAGWFFHQKHVHPVGRKKTLITTVPGALEGQHSEDNK